MQNQGVARYAAKGLSALDSSEVLDRPAARAAKGARWCLKNPAFKQLLQGRWLGHSLHPLLTDFTEGPWMAASFLDLFGPSGSETAARRLLGFGLIMAVPTHLSGFAEWVDVDSQRNRRLGMAHAMSVSAATLLYAASYLARLRGRQPAAVALGLAGGITALLDGYVGGHLSHGRGVAVGETF